MVVVVVARKGGTTCSFAEGADSTSCRRPMLGERFSLSSIDAHILDGGAFVCHALDTADAAEVSTVEMTVVSPSPPKKTIRQAI